MPADSVGAGASWWAALPAVVPVSLRERGDTAGRGRATPIVDRSAAQHLVRRRRHLELEAVRSADGELLRSDAIDGAHLSSAALARLEHLLGRALAQLGVEGRQVEVVDDGVCCALRREPGCSTSVSSPEGTLTLRDREVVLRPTGGGSPPARVPAHREGARPRDVPAHPPPRARSGPVVHPAPGLPPAPERRHGSAVQDRHGASTSTAASHLWSPPAPARVRAACAGAGVDGVGSGGAQLTRSRRPRP